MSTNWVNIITKPETAKAFQITSELLAEKNNTTETLDKDGAFSIVYKNKTATLIIEYTQSIDLIEINAEINDWIINEDDYLFYVCTDATFRERYQVV